MSSESHLNAAVAGLIKRSYTRAVQPKKWARLVRDLVEKSQSRENDQGIEFDGEKPPHSTEGAQHVIAECLLLELSRTSSPPALLLAYLAQSLLADIVSGSTLALHLLFLLFDPRPNPASRSSSSSTDDIPTNHLSTDFVSVVSGIIVSHPTGLGPGNTFPALIEIPGPTQAGSSAPPTASHSSARSAPALSLLLPLIRLCSSSSSSAASSSTSSTTAVIAPILALASRLAGLLPADPPPSFDAGLEVAQLCSELPEELARPLRESLSGMIGEFPLPDTTAPTLLAPTQMMVIDGAPLPTSATSAVVPTLNPADMIRPASGPLPLSLTHTVRFLVEQAHRAHARVSNPSYRSRPPIPPPNHMQIVRLGPGLTNDPSALLSTILSVGMKPLELWTAGSSGATRGWCFFVEEIPILLRWWREVEDSKFPFPADLREALEARLTESNVQLEQLSSGLMGFYTASFAQAEPSEDSGSYSEPEGWTILSVRETIVRRYIEYGLLDDEALVALVPNANRQAPTTNPESLMHRLASSTKVHIPALEFFIILAYGAARSFSTEVVQALETNTLPENLLENLSGSPNLLNILASYITPTDLLSLVENKLLNRPDDPGARADDPQGNLIRYGAGVMFAEAICAHHQLPLPDLLDDFRRAKALSDLNDNQKSLMNGWVKALFGSDGIDDQILMLSSAQGFCACVVTLIQQSIIAASSDLIDLDTLRSGLSYFSQPLLSWSLGGVVAWLCSEIERQGPMAGLHLEVLQTLVLDSSFPQSLLLVNEKAINRVLDPMTGLGPVLQSSGFDSLAVQAKVPPGLPTIVPDLRSELQALRHIDLAPSTWPATLLDAVVASSRSLGSAGIVSTILSELIRPPTTEIGTDGSVLVSTSDELAALFALLFSLSLDRQNPAQDTSPPALPLIHALVDAVFPSLFDPSSPFNTENGTSGLGSVGSTGSTLTSSGNGAPAPSPQAPQVIYRVLRYALILVPEAGQVGDLADVLAGHLAEELTYQLGKGQPNAKAGAKGEREKEKESGGKGSEGSGKNGRAGADGEKDEDGDVEMGGGGKEERERTGPKERDTSGGKGVRGVARKGKGNETKEGGVLERPLGAGQRALLDSLVAAFEGDAEVKARWSALASLR